MKTRHSGFTLIELLITVALVGVLASLAVPSFRTLYVKRAVQAAADSFIVDMRFARAEAIKRSARVTMCQSTTGTSCTTAGNVWQSGWIIFYDANGNGAFDSADGDEVVRVQQALTAIASMQSSTPSTDSKNFTFQSAGWAKVGSEQSFFLKAAGSGASTLDRLICVSIQGRAALRKEGDASCA